MFDLLLVSMALFRVNLILFTTRIATTDLTLKYVLYMSVFFHIHTQRVCKQYQVLDHPVVESLCTTLVSGIVITDLIDSNEPIDSQRKPFDPSFFWGKLSV